MHRHRVAEWLREMLLHFPSNLKDPGSNPAAYGRAKSLPWPESPGPLLVRQAVNRALPRRGERAGYPSPQKTIYIYIYIFGHIRVIKPPVPTSLFRPPERPCIKRRWSATSQTDAGGPPAHPRPFPSTRSPGRRLGLAGPHGRRLARRLGGIEHLELAHPPAGRETKRVQDPRPTVRHGKVHRDPVPPRHPGFRPSAPPTRPA